MKTLHVGLALAALAYCASFASTPAPARAQEVEDESSWIRRTHHAASPAVVTIRCGSRMGTGFLFGDDRVVAATDAWDRCTRGIEVVTLSGAAIPVDVGRVSAGGVALLRLSAAAGGEGLEARSEPAQVGDRIVIVDRTRHGARYAITGRVSGTAGDILTSDVRDDSVHAGAPVLDADGRVVGVVRRERRSDRVTIVPVGRLVELDQAPEASLGLPLSFDLGILGALEWDEDPRVDGRGVMLAGFGGAVRLNLFDRLTLIASYAYVRDTSDLFEHDGLVERVATRHRVDASLGWRFLGFYGVNAYITPSVGAAARWTEWTDRQARLRRDDPMCDPATSACEVSVDVVETDDDEFSISPYLRLALSAGWGELAYSLGLAFDPDTLVHTLTLTAWLGGNR